MRRVRLGGTLLLLLLLRLALLLLLAVSRLLLLLLLLLLSVSLFLLLLRLLLFDLRGELQDQLLGLSRRVELERLRQHPLCLG